MATLDRECDGRCLPRPLTTQKLWIQGWGVLRWCATNNTCGENDNNTERERQDTHALYIHRDEGTGHVASSRARSVCTIFKRKKVKERHNFPSFFPTLAWKGSGFEIRVSDKTFRFKAHTIIINSSNTENI